MKEADKEDDIEEIGVQGGQKKTKLEDRECATKPTTH